MSCSSCNYLKESDRKDGALCGSLYYCEKKKCYINGSGCCSNYQKSYTRSNSSCSEIYNAGNGFSDDDRPIAFHLVSLILIIIIGLIITWLNNMQM